MKKRYKLMVLHLLIIDMDESKISIKKEVFSLEKLKKYKLFKKQY